MNFDRRKFMNWLLEIDPDIDFDDVDRPMMMVYPAFSGCYLDRDAIITIDTPEQFQFLALYMDEFSCGWTYKNTTIWREGDVWGADHQWIVNGFPQVYHISLLDFNNDTEMVDFIIMLNDGKLPEAAPDDSPVKGNPYVSAMTAVSYGYYTHLSPFLFETYEDWMREVKETSFDEPDVFWGDNDSHDWEWAREDAEAQVIEWFNNWHASYTPQMVRDAIDWLRDNAGVEDDDENLAELLEMEKNALMRNDLERKELGSGESSSDDKAMGE